MCINGMYFVDAMLHKCRLYLRNSNMQSSMVAYFISVPRRPVQLLSSATAALHSVVKTLPNFLSSFVSQILLKVRDNMVCTSLW